MSDDNRSGYPIQYSASVPVKANDPAYWHPPPYSRSTSTASVDSVYPTSSVGNDVEDDDVDDEENWSDTLEDFGQNLPFGQIKFGQNKFEQFPHFLKPNSDNFNYGEEEDQDKTPVTAKRFNESSLHLVAQRLEQIPTQEIVAFPAAVIREKTPPAVSMQQPVSRSEMERQISRSEMERQISRQEMERSISRQEVDRPPSRASLAPGSVKKTRAPDPPLPKPDQLQPQQQDSQQQPEIQARQLPSMSSFPVSLTGGLPVKRLSRPIAVPAVAEGRPGMNFPLTHDNPSTDNPFEPAGSSDLPPSGYIRPRQPSFSYPVVKNPAAKVTNPSPTRPVVVEEKAPAFGYPAVSRTGTAQSEIRPKRLDSPQPASMRSLSPNVATTETSSALSTSPSSSRCPHCKIHSWLPHSAGCPNKK